MRISSTTVSPLPASLGFKILSPSQVTVNGLGMASNGFPVITSTSPVVRQPAAIRVQGTDIAAWWNPGTGLAQYPTVSQGADQVGMLRLGFWTDAFQGAIQTIQFTRTGTGNDSDISDVKIYKDCDADGVFTPSLDNCSISTGVQFVNQVASITLPSNFLVTPTTTYMFIAYHIAPSASLNTQGVSIPGAAAVFSPDNSSIVSFAAINSSLVTVTPSIDELDVTRVNDPTGGFDVPSVATQGDKNVPLMKLSMHVRNPLGIGLVNSAVLTHLRLDRGDPFHLNHGRDITAVRVYYDYNNNGQFDVGVDTPGLARPARRSSSRMIRSIARYRCVDDDADLRAEHHQLSAGAGTHHDRQRSRDLYRRRRGQ